MSSTNFQIFVACVFTSRSFIIAKNRIGPSLVPWGTPAFIGNQSDVFPPSLTRCRRLVRKLIIQGNKDDLTPRSNNFNISKLCPIRSNAFSKSRKQSLRCFSGHSKLHNQVWIMSRRQQVVDVPFKHPNCLGSILSLISVIIHPTTKSSRTLARQGVSEMGLVSPSQVGGCDFVMLETSSFCLFLR